MPNKSLPPVKKEKAPRFYCDYCGTEVSGKVEKCPSCGRYFSSIKCPKCGFSGREELFTDGCPVCFYAKGSGGKRPSGRQDSSGRQAGRGAKTPPDSGIESWIYIVAASLLVLTLAVLFFHD